MSAAGRTFGQLAYRPPNRDAGPRAAGAWAMVMRPHVAIMAKRVLVKARPTEAGQLVVMDNQETVKLLDWFMQLYPLAMSADTRDYFDQQLGAALQREDQVAEVLAGGGSFFGLREPARPGMPFYERGSNVSFQEVSAQLAVTTGRLLIGDELGFGKTFQSILALNAALSLPALFVCQAHLPEQIEAEIKATLPWLSTHIVKRQKSYDVAGLDGRDPDVLIISYAKLEHWSWDLAGKIRTVVFDEVQEMRHHDTNRYSAGYHVASTADRVIGLSNTPVYNYADEAFSVVDLIHPGFLGSRDEFKREWCVGEDGKLVLKDPGAFGGYLRESGLMIARSYKDVGLYDDDPDWWGAEEPPAGWAPSGEWKPLPTPVILPNPVNVDFDEAVIERAKSDAAEMARLVLTQTTNENRTAKFAAAGQLDMKIRQATGIAKAPTVAAYIRMLLASKERVVVFGWHRAVYDLWMDLLADFNPVLYTGTESVKQKRESKAAFLSGDSRILVISLRSGTGLDGLQHVCEDVVFGELDWSPAVQRQGIGRVARGLRRTNTVTAHYCISDGGTDPLMAEILQIKRNIAEPMMSSDGEVVQIAPPDPDRIKRLAESILALGPGDLNERLAS